MPHLAFGTPRKLPKAESLSGRVGVLDIAFAGVGGKSGSFETVTLPFITALGERLRIWVDHHDHDEHGRYRDDPRFVRHAETLGPRTTLRLLARGATDL